MSRRTYVTPAALLRRTAERIESDERRVAFGPKATTGPMGNLAPLTQATVIRALRDLADVRDTPKVDVDALIADRIALIRQVDDLTTQLNAALDASSIAEHARLQAEHERDEARHDARHAPGLAREVDRLGTQVHSLLTTAARAAAIQPITVELRGDTEATDWRTVALALAEALNPTERIEYRAAGS